VAFAPYASIDDFKAWVVLNDSVDDPVLVGVLNSVTRWIDQFCGRHFWRDGAPASEVARTFISKCGHDVEIDDLVPGTITTLKTDSSGDGVYETTWSASDYQLQPVNRPAGEPFTTVEAVGSRTFPVKSSGQSRANRVEITGIWGWATVPDTVTQACLIQASRTLKRRHSPEGVVGFADLGVVRFQSTLDPDVQTLLDDFVSVGI
jgi:hypothetical protein